MKTVSSLVPAYILGVLLAATVLPASAQNDAGTPPLTPNMALPLPQVLKLPEGAQPGIVTTDRSQYKPGQPVRITFRITNASGKAITYDFGTGQRFDISVSSPAGAEIWRWSQGRLFSQYLSVLHLAPGKSLAYTALWNGRDRFGHPAVPGNYTLNAHLTSDNRPAITGGVLVNIDPDPTNMGVPTRTPTESGAIRQIDPAPQVSAKMTILIKG